MFSPHLIIHGNLTKWGQKAGRAGDLRIPVLPVPRKFFLLCGLGFPPGQNETPEALKTLLRSSFKYRMEPDAYNHVCRTEADVVPGLRIE